MKANKNYKNILPVSFNNLALQQKRLESKIYEKIKHVLAHGKYILGPEVSELENKLSKYSNAKYVATCASGTDALILSLMAHNIGKGDAVLCPSFTFPATAEAIVLTGAEPVFVDVDKDTYNICINSLEHTIEKNKNNYKAILIVDLYGLPADYKALSKISKKYGLVLIADAAQSFGAEYLEKKVGTLADITCVSFFPAKPLGCYGDGGAILTEDKNIWNKILSLRAHGKGREKYEIEFVGLNSRLDTIQAAILLAKLEDFDWELTQRNKIAKLYSSALKGYVTIPIIPKGAKSAWAQYTIQHTNRSNIQSNLEKQGVPTMIYYPTPMHLQKPYRKYIANNLFNSEALSKEVLSLPIYPDMNMETLDYIIFKLRETL